MPGNPAAPALFEGTIGHHRSEGAEHAFALRVFYAYLDVDTVRDTLDRLPFWSARRSSPLRFQSSDHLDGSGAPLGDAVRHLVADRTGHRPGGPVLLLTQVRTLGFVFNPISVFFCWSADTAVLEALVLEVSNTPWNERCWYVLTPDQQDAHGVWSFPKEMHVSPFLDMDLTYDVRLEGPGDALRLRIADRRGDTTVFAAELALRRVPFDRWHAVVVPLRHPLQTWRVFAAIHAHAVRLWRKGVRINPHPSRGFDPSQSSELSHPADVPQDAAQLTSRRSPHGHHGPRPRRPHGGARRADPSSGRTTHGR